MRLGAVVLVVLSLLQAAGLVTRQFSGRVRAGMPEWGFRSVFDGQGDDLSELGGLERVEVLSGQRVLQAISFEEGDGAANFGPAGEQVRLEDVDCDGYKDLLVLKDVGYGGVNRWYFLYRYDARAGKFVRYARFEELPFVGVNCRTKTVRTHNRGGWAGCLYEGGTYRWVSGELIPVRYVQQDADGEERVARTIYRWRGGKKVLQSKRSYPVADCHAGEDGLE